MSLRTPLARVRGLGAAKEGVAHFWHQRVTALALVPLTIWFVISVLVLAGSDYVHFRAWLALPGNATLMILLVACVFHHGQLGLQVVIEDYIHCPALKLASVIAVKFGAILFGLFAAVAVLRAGVLGG
jgi:succinate dehydrogenase / fumarate reductase membrane anchor subunit